MLERLLLQSFSAGAQFGVGLEPGLAEKIHQSLAKIVQQQEATGQSSILLVNPQLRPWLAKLFIHSIPGLHVLGYNEVVETKRIRVVASVGGELAASLATPEGTEVA